MDPRFRQEPDSDGPGLTFANPSAQVKNRSSIPYHPFTNVCRWPPGDLGSRENLAVLQVDG